MQVLTNILASATTWETLGFACAIFLLCGHRIRTWFSKWLSKNNSKIHEDIQSATKLEQDAHALLHQYQKQAADQQKQLETLKKQNNRELQELKKDISKKTAEALLQQKEATNIHIRLVATQHQQKMMAGILDKFTKNVSADIKKQKKENMDNSIHHLMDFLEKDSEIFRQL